MTADGIEFFNGIFEKKRQEIGIYIDHIHVEKPQEKVKIEPFLAEWKKPFNHMKIKMN
jgi:hypothetical protein